MGWKGKECRKEREPGKRKGQQAVGAPSLICPKCLWASASGQPKDEWMAGSGGDVEMFRGVKAIKRKLGEPLLRICVPFLGTHGQDIGLILES